MRNRHNHPFSQFEAFANVLNDVLGGESSTMKTTSKHEPAINILEGENDYHIEVAAPGLSKEDFDITIDKDQLTVKVQKEDKALEGKAIKSEFNFNSFKRSFHLSEDIDRSKISANYDKGILFIRLEKKEEAIEKGPLSIEIS